MFSILHISDLHRSPDDPISNEELLAGLSTDRTRYTKSDPSIRPPDAIVISGDVIQGVGLGHSDSQGALRDQYEVAERFIAQLAEDFVDGDRSRVIIAPGNHDIDWNIAKEAMVVVPTEEEPSPAKAFSVESNYRWNWKDKRFYRIVRPEIYAQRLNAYWDFIERFYMGVSNIPFLSRDKKFGLFSLWNGRVGLAVFNSCHGNDCFASHGAIEPSAIALAQNMMTRDHRFGLMVAAWHHSVQGAPYRTDYMDVDQVYNMVGYGFRLGLHGHQHRHQVLPMHVDLPERETMALVSAGSLCAGSKELPTGNYRQYNIIEIADDLLSARVHVRQMETAHLFSGRHLTMAGGRTYVEINWGPPPLGTPIPLLSNEAPPQIVISAERMAAAGNSAGAAESLLNWMPQLSGYARTIFLEACVKAGKWEWIIIKLAEPQSIAELVAFVEACDRTRNSRLALEALNQYGNHLEMPASQLRELERRLRVRGGLE
jgi:hypothetical protein